MTTSPVRVGIVMGSASDLPVVKKAQEQLHALSVVTDMRILSAHRTPDDLETWMTDIEKSGCQVYIACAGMAAHLAGAVAARTVLPVIGVPLEGGLNGGIDALYSTVQMPPGIPVATVAVGKAGATNAAFLAAQILAISDAQLSVRLEEQREHKRAEIRQSNHQILQ